MNKNHRKYFGGYIALVSIVLISVTLLALVLGQSTRAFYARLDALSYEYQNQARENAAACVRSAQVLVAEYAHPVDAFHIPEGVCAFEAWETDTAETALTTSGEYHGAHARVRARIQNDTGALLSLQEIPSQ